MREINTKQEKAQNCLQTIYRYEFLGHSRLKEGAQNIYEKLSGDLDLSRQEVKLLSFISEALGYKDIHACRKAMNMRLEEMRQMLRKLTDVGFVSARFSFNDDDEELIYELSQKFHDELKRSETLKSISEREFHNAVRIYAEDIRTGSFNIELACQNLEHIIRLNPHFQFSKGYAELEGRTLPLPEKCSLFYMAGIFVLQGLTPLDSRKMFADPDDLALTAQEQYAAVRKTVEDGMVGLLGRGYVVVAPDDGKEDKMAAIDKKLYLLSDKVVSILFRGMTYLIDYGQLSRMAEVIKNEHIKPKELFFDEGRDGQLQLLRTVIQPSRYEQFVASLQKNGMPTGVTALFHGAPGTGKTELAKQLARTSGRDIFVADVARLYGCYWGESEKNMRELFRSFRYLNALSAQSPILLFNEADGIIGKRLETVRAIDKSENAVQTIVLQELESFEGVFIATTNLAVNLDQAFDRRFLIKVEFCDPTPQTAAKMWRAKIPELTSEEAMQIASRFPFCGGKIDNVTKKRMLLQAANNATLSLQEMMELCRNEELKSEGEGAYFRHFQIVRSSKIKTCELFYDEIMMPAIETIRRMVVSDDFGEMIAVLKQEGLSGSANILLHGAPGTGKTELAMQLARESGRDIYIVDVSKLHDGLVGDGERNVRELFAKFRHQQKTAERTPILLFNEADGVIGKRLQVARSNDKEENALQSILLQELENFEGIFIATTNLIGNIDEAFDRRFLFKVEFRKPSPLTAAKIWRTRIPEMDYSEAVALAKEFPFSGGQIDNIAKRRAICKAVYKRTPSHEEMREYCLEEQFRARESIHSAVPTYGFSQYLG